MAWFIPIVKRKTVNKLHEPTMWIAKSEAINYVCCFMNLALNSSQWKIHLQIVILFPLELHLLWTHRVFPVILRFLKIFARPHSGASYCGCPPASNFLEAKPFVLGTVSNIDIDFSISYLFFTFFMWILEFCNVCFIVTEELFNQKET